VLSRDELQGVTAHDFSHLLNGDSKINLRLLGLVHGILVIGLIGSRILRSFGRSSSSESRRKVNPGGLGVIVFVGVAVYLIGSIGVFFTRLIKAAVCRERELLADASGVQFTRNAAGLAGALKKIGRLDRGSRLVAPGAEEASHFYFSEGIPHFTALMSTHPPLEQRIRLLDPSFQGELPRGQLQPVAVDEEIPVVAAAVQSERGFPVHPRAVIASVGALGDEHIAYAQSLVTRIPERLRDSIREPSVARAIVLGLLLDRNPETRAAQLTTLLPREKCDLRALDGALDRLADTAPRLRGEILGACVAAVATDGTVTIAEGELLRAVADSLGCPMPPLLPGQHVRATGERRALG